ncbi:hypothetical protein ACYSNR_11550 [Enterococcus sp. LJL128]|uniref:hypothetical protein n=1 Tax=Enterococcus sp. LJL51 TaxID=3416656 RepID=UPI003CF2621F
MNRKLLKLFEKLKIIISGIKEGVEEALHLYKVALQMIIMQIVIALIRVSFPEFHKNYYWIFEWVNLFIAIYGVIQMFIFTYKIYTKEWRKLDSLLQEYEGEASKFDFSFPNDFIKGIYLGEGVRGNNVDFIKKLDSGVKKLDPSQKKIALIHIRNYNSNSFNFFSGYYIFGILSILATISPLFSFEMLKASSAFFITVTIYALTVGRYIYRINKKKIYICKIVEDVLRYSIE